MVFGRTKTLVQFRTEKLPSIREGGRLLVTDDEIIVPKNAYRAWFIRTTWEGKVYEDYIIAVKPNILIEITREYYTDGSYVDKRWKIEVNRVFPPFKNLKISPPAREGENWSHVDGEKIFEPQITEEVREVSFQSS